MDNTRAPKTEPLEQIVIDPMHDEMQIPDHAIRRIARFLLPKIQAEFTQKEQSDETRNG
ncbi:MAG: hypothetical protein IJ206_13890 [Oscillospiraceae bacterium]|nr:hypothetical protein [Oscillospiraceae bacterium]